MHAAISKRYTESTVNRCRHENLNLFLFVISKKTENLIRFINTQICLGNLLLFKCGIIGIAFSGWQHGRCLSDEYGRYVQHDDY